MFILETSHVDSFPKWTFWKACVDAHLHISDNEFCDNDEGIKFFFKFILALNSSIWVVFVHKLLSTSNSAPSIQRVHFIPEGQVFSNMDFNFHFKIAQSKNDKLVLLKTLQTVSYDTMPCNPVQYGLMQYNSVSFYCQVNQKFILHPCPRSVQKDVQKMMYKEFAFPKNTCHVMI